MAVGSNALTSKSIVSQGQLPPKVVKGLFEEVGYESLVAKVAGTVPMNINGTNVPIHVGEPVAGVVGEGELKPVIGMKSGFKTYKPIKVAGIMYMSDEAEMVDNMGLVSEVKPQLVKALARAIDLAVLHGKDGVKNALIPDQEYLAKTKNVVRLGTASKEEHGLAGDMLAAYQSLTDAGGELNGFVGDTRLRPRFGVTMQANGTPLLTQGQGANLRERFDSVMGVPAMWHRKAVSGHMGAVPDSYTRAFMGDFEDAIKIGYVDSMRFKVTDQATIVDGGQTIHLWQQNLKAVLIEAMFGWVIRDVDGFTRLTVAPDQFKTGTAYAKDSLVTSDNKEYRAKTDIASASTEPKSDTTNWEKVA